MERVPPNGEMANPFSLKQLLKESVGKIQMVLLH